MFLLLLLIESMHHHHARTILPDRSDQQHVSECVCMHTWTHVSNHSTLPMNQSIDQSTPSPSSSPHPPPEINPTDQSINFLFLPPTHHHHHHQKTLRREYASFFAPMERAYYSPTVQFVDPLTSLQGRSVGR